MGQQSKIRMLKLVALLPLLFHLVSADSETFQRIYAERLSFIQNVTGQFSTFRGTTMEMKNLQNYGCWCYFHELHGEGRGQPVDGYDTACMHYHHGVQCAKHEIPDCDPASTFFLSVTMPHPDDPKDMITDCDPAKINNECQIATCYLEAFFAKLLIAQDLIELQNPDYEKYQVQDKTDMCKRHGGPRQDRTCCVDYSQNTRRMSVPSKC